MQNWQCSECRPVYWSFNQGTPYTGIAYSQTLPSPPYEQQSLSEFAAAVSTTTGGITRYGNDCSGFVSLAWRLGTRYATPGFESDATAPGGYVTSRGAIGHAQNTILLSGDALVKSGDHMVLFKERIATGIQTREQTADPYRTTPGAKYKDWTWSQLQSYRPIRRNLIDETVYTGNLSASGQSGWQPNELSYYSSASGVHSGRLGGPNNNADFDLYLYKWDWISSSWQSVASSLKTFASESIDYIGAPGYYIWKISSYSGSGNYELSIKKP